jgi:hypothetical protein
VPANMRIGLARDTVAAKGLALLATEAVALVGHPEVAFIDVQEEGERRGSVNGMVRMTAHREAAGGTGAVVRKPPMKEPAGVETPGFAGWTIPTPVEGRALGRTEILYVHSSDPTSNHPPPARRGPPPPKSDLPRALKRPKITAGYPVEWATLGCFQESCHQPQNLEKAMIRLMAFAAFALSVTTSAQAAPIAPVNEPDGMITQVAFACGPGRTRINGVCVARTTIRHARRCVRWYGGACAYWHYY